MNCSCIFYKSDMIQMIFTIVSCNLNVKNNELCLCSLNNRAGGLFFPICKKTTLLFPDMMPKYRLLYFRAIVFLESNWNVFFKKRVLCCLFIVHTPVSLRTGLFSCIFFDGLSLVRDCSSV